MIRRSVLMIVAVSAAYASTPAERAIEAARLAIQKEASRAEYHTALGMALARRARETADPAYYTQAEEALAKSLAISPDDFEAQKTKAWVLLGKHEFAKALELAQKLNKRMPDDVLVYGFLADAHIELGNYSEAQKAAQWMLDLRPGNVAGLTRGAYLRELFGDIGGAIDFMTQAFQRMRPEETEDRAWILTHVGHLQLAEGNIEGAERSVNHALQLFPNYHYALGVLAKVRLAQKNYAAAAEVYRERYTVAPHPENLYDLACALKKAGRLEEAKKAFAEFEVDARKEMDGPDNSNRELVMYYLEHTGRPAEGLRIAKREAGLKQDVHTLDVYGWALYKNGEAREAGKQLEEALSVGIRDAQILYHAAVIAEALKDRTAAATHLRKAMKANPSSPFADEIVRLLAKVEPAAEGN